MSNELKSTINLKIGGSQSTESSDMSDDLDDITINPINSDSEETPEKTYENTLQDKLDNVDIDELRKLLNKSNIKRIQQQVVDQVGEYKDNDKLPKVSIEAVQEIDEQIEIINQDKPDLFITELTYLLSISDRTYEDEELIQDLFDNLAHIYKKKHNKQKLNINDIYKINDRIEVLINFIKKHTVYRLNENTLKKYPTSKITQPNSSIIKKSFGKPNFYNEIKPKEFNQERVRGSDFSLSFSNKLVNNYLNGKINKKWLKPIVQDRKKIYTDEIPSKKTEPPTFNLQNINRILEERNNNNEKMKIYSVKFAEESLNLFMPNTDENEQSNLSLHQQYSNILDNRSGITFDDYELKKHQIEAPYESYKSKDSVLLDITNNNYWDEEIIIKDKTKSNMGILTSYNVIRDCFEDCSFDSNIWKEPQYTNINGYFIKNRKVLAPLYKLVDHPIPQAKKEFGNRFSLKKQYCNGTIDDTIYIGKLASKVEDGKYNIVNQDFHNSIISPAEKKLLSDPNIIVEENKLNVVGYMSELNYRNHISFTDQGYNLLDIVIKSQKKVNNDYLFREILLDDCNPEDLKSVCINKSETNKPFLDVIEEMQENINDKNDLIEGSYYLISTSKKINNPLLEINRNPENFNYIVKYQPHDNDYIRRFGYCLFSYNNQLAKTWSSMKNLIDMDVYDSLELDGTDSVYLLNDTLLIDDYIHYFKNRITPNIYSSNYGKIIIDTEESDLNPEIDPFQLYIIQDDDNEIEFSNKKYFLGLYNYDNTSQKNQWFLFYFTNRLLPVELKTSKIIKLIYSDLPKQNIYNCIIRNYFIDYNIIYDLLPFSNDRTLSNTIYRFEKQSAEFNELSDKEKHSEILSKVVPSIKEIISDIPEDMFNLYDLQKIFTKYDYQLSDITQDLYDKYIKNKFNQQVDIHLEHNENINKELHTSFNEQKTQNQFLRNINNNLLKTTHELIQNNNLNNLDKTFDTALYQEKDKKKSKNPVVDIYRNRIFGDILKYNNISDNFTSEDLFDYLKLQITNLHNYQNTHSKNINLIRNCINDIYFFFKNDCLPLKTNSQLEKIEESYVSNYKRELLNISLDHDKLISHLKQIKNLYPTFPFFNINSLENIDNELQINIDYTLNWLKKTQDQGNSIFTICNILKLFDVLLIYMGDSRINRVSQEDINTLQDKLDILKRTYKEHQEKYKFYIDYCNGYTVSKLYRTRESLLEDNNKQDLRFDREFDNSVNNMNILNKIMATYGENKVTDENRNKLYSKLSQEIKMYYPYESSTNINIMANVLLDNYGRLVKKNRGYRKVNGGDYAILIDLDKRQLFKRVHDIWIQVSDREIGDEKDLCQQEAMWINSFTVDGLLGVLSKETSYKKGQCQYQDDFTMLDNIGKLDNRCVPKLMLQWIRKIHHTHRKLQKKQSFLNMKDDILEKLTVNHKTLRKQIKYLELFNERQDIYREQTIQKKNITDLEKFCPYYNKKCEILLIEDEDERLVELGKMFTTLPYYESNEEGKKDFIYWSDSECPELSKICKHYMNLSAMANLLPEEKQTKLDLLVSQWGTEPKDGKIYCKNCGEIIYLQEDDTLEGFTEEGGVLTTRELVDTRFELGNLQISDFNPITERHKRNAFFLFSNFFKMAHVHVDDKTFYNILTKIDEFEFNDLGYGNHLIKINKAGTPKNTVMNAGWRHIYELNQYFDKKNSKLPEEQHIILKQDLIRKVKKDEQVPDLPSIFTINDFCNLVGKNQLPDPICEAGIREFIFSPREKTKGKRIQSIKNEIKSVFREYYYNLIIKTLAIIDLYVNFIDSGLIIPKMLSLLSVSSRKNPTLYPWNIIIPYERGVKIREDTIVEKINEYKPYLLSKYPELLDISNQNNSKLFQQKLSKLSHLPLFKPRMPYYDSKGDVVLKDTDTVEGRVIEKIDKIIANTSQKEQVIGRFCCLSHINSLGQQVNYDIHLKNKLVEDVFYLSGYHSDLVNSNISYNLLEDIKKAEETTWINKNKLFSKTGSDTLYIENNKEIPLREYLSYMKENFTETIQHNGNQCTLTNFSIKNNIFLNYCTEKDIFGLPRIFITYQDNDIDLVYNIKKSLDKHRQQSSSKHYRSNELPENQNNTDTETSVEVSSDSDFSSTENAGVSESTRSNMEGGSSSLEEDMPGENSSEIDTSSSEVDSSEVSGEEKSSSNESVVKDVEVVEKVSKPLIPQELDIEQVEVKESSSDKEYIDEETDDNIEIECVVIEDYIEDKDKPLIREKLLKEINDKYGDKLTANEKANKIRNLIENNGVITKCVVSGKTKEEIENTIKDQIINDRDNFIDTLRKITNRVRMDKAIVHKNIIPDSINNFDNTIYMDLVRVIKQLEMTNIYLINGINAESKELETPLNNIISQYKQLLQEDSEVYPIIFKTYSEITKSEKNTFNDSIARIWEDTDGDDIFQSYYDREIDIINNIKPVLQKILDVENNMIRENYFYENINELEFDKNGQYKWGKFNNILNENKKNIEKSLKIDGILLNSPEGIKESRYKEELFTRLTEINQTTNLKKYLYFLRQIIRLFIREKDRLQNIVTSSSSDSSESDSSSETEEVTNNNLSGKDFNQKISTFLASKQKDLNRNFEDADRVSVALLSYIKKRTKKIVKSKGNLLVLDSLKNKKDIESKLSILSDILKSLDNFKINYLKIKYEIIQDIISLFDVPELSDSLVNCVAIKPRYVNNLLLFIIMNTIVSLFKKQQLNSNYNTFVNRIIIREFFERLIENHNLNDCGVEIIENWLNYYSDEKNKARMGQYDTLTNDSKIVRMAYRAVGLGKEFNKMQGWGEVLDLTDLNDANEEFDETLFNIDQDDQDVYKKEREANRNMDDIGTMGLKEVVDDGDEIAIPTY